MKIKQLKLKSDYRSLSSGTEIVFEDDINIFIGPNASGKSTILSLVRLFLNELFEKYDLDFINKEYSYKESSKLHSNQYKIYFSEGESIKVEITIGEYKEIITKLNNYIDKFKQEKNDSSIQKLIEELPSKFNKDSFGDKTIKIKLSSNGCEVLDGVNLFNFIQTYSKFYAIKLLKSGQSLDFSGMVFSLDFLDKDNTQGVINLDIRNTEDRQMYSAISNKRKEHASDQKGNLIIDYIAELYSNNFFRVFKNDEKYKAFAIPSEVNTQIKDIFDFELYVKHNDTNGYPWMGAQLLVKNSNGDLSEINQLSSGQFQLLNIYAALKLAQTSNGILVLDEPEIHLHKFFQDKLRLLLTQHLESTGSQVIIATHSGMLMNSQLISKTTRFYKDKDSNKYKAKKSNYEIEVQKSTDKVKNDFIEMLRIDRNDHILFTNNVILVEGKGDKIFFEKLFEDTDSKIQFEVIDVSGDGSIDKYFQYCQSMLINVFGIIDSKHLQKEIDKKNTTDYLNIEKLITDKKEKNYYYLSFNLTEHNFTEENEDNEINLETFLPDCLVNSDNGKADVGKMIEFFNKKGWQENYEKEMKPEKAQHKYITDLISEIQKKFI